MDNQGVGVGSVNPELPQAKFPIIIIILISIIAFGLGALFILFVVPGSGKIQKGTSLVTNNGKIVLPTKAVRIQGCADRQGALYVEPQNIPVGPVFMVYDGEVIGIEYMLGKDEFLSGKSYESLAGLDIKVNHARIGFLSAGHEGYASPHYHIFLYTVPESVERGIICPKAPGETGTSPATPSGTFITPTTSSMF